MITMSSEMKKRTIRSSTMQPVSWSMFQRILNELRHGTGNIVYYADEYWYVNDCRLVFFELEAIADGHKKTVLYSHCKIKRVQSRLVRR